MEFLKGLTPKETLELDELQDASRIGTTVKVNGAVHTIRDMGELSFVVLRKRSGLLQCIFEDGFTAFDVKNVREEEALEVTGILERDERAPHGIEIRVKEVKVLSTPYDVPPLPVGKWKLGTSLEAKLNYRSVSLRNMRERAKFRIQEGIVRGFRDFLYSQQFTEIHTPKIGSKGAEGGSNVFKLEYFHRPAVLAQSPQFYKQAMVPVYERVFEIGPVFRAEKHNTQRHLNEYTSMDFEMGFIDGFEDVMQMETKVLQNIMVVLKADYAPQLAALHVALPDVTRIPAVRFDEAKRMVSEKYGRAIRDPFDLEPEEEQLISRLFAEEYGSEFVFVTHYPSKKRPFYAADDPEDPRYTLSFDLLFRGLEVTTGGQRIHDYDTQVAKMLKKGMNPEDFAGYLMIHKYGTCPHGGLGLGLERLTARLLGENNVRETCLFPRDQQRIEP